MYNTYLLLSGDIINKLVLNVCEMRPPHYFSTINTIKIKLAGATLSLQKLKPPPGGGGGSISACALKRGRADTAAAAVKSRDQQQ